jgi:MFS family permease
MVGVDASRRPSLWRSPDFLKLWTGETVSLLGSQVSLLAIPLAAISILHASNFQVGLLTSAETVPFLLVGLPAGVWVDRWRRRPVLITADVGRAIFLGSIPLAYALGWLTIWQLYAVAFSTGILTVFFDVAYQSYLPALVGRAHLIDGNAKLEISRSAAQVGGPGLAGELIHLLRAPTAVAVDAASFLASAAGIAAITKPEPRVAVAASRERAGMKAEIGEGLRYVLGHRFLRRIAGATSTSNLFSSLFGTVLLLYMVHNLRYGAGTIGLVFLLGNIGVLLGALLASPLGRRFGVGPVCGAALVVAGLGGLLAPLATRSTGFGILVVSLFLISATNPIYNVNQVSLRQAICPERLLGRMNATMRFLVWGTLPVGAFLAGVLSTAIGLRSALWVGAAGGCLAFVWVIGGPVWSVREMPELEPDPAGGVEAGGVDAGSGVAGGGVAAGAPVPPQAPVPPRE